MKVYLYVSFIEGPGAYVLTLVSMVGVQGFKVNVSLSMILLNVSVEIIQLEDFDLDLNLTLDNSVIWSFLNYKMEIIILLTFSVL